MNTRRRYQPIILSLITVLGSQAQTMHEPWMEEDLPFPLFQRFLSNDESLSFCEPRGDCEMCTATQLNAQDECKATSRIQLFSCRAEKEGKRNSYVSLSEFCFIRVSVLALLRTQTQLTLCSSGAVQGLKQMKSF